MLLRLINKYHSVVRILNKMLTNDLQLNNEGIVTVKQKVTVLSLASWIKTCL